jgi:hypothetical protein
MATGNIHLLGNAWLMAPRMKTTVGENVQLCVKDGKNSAMDDDQIMS